MQKPLCPANAGVRVFMSMSMFMFITASLLLASGVRAQSGQDDEHFTILITASRFAETVDETLAPVTIITRQEIEERQASTLEEVLRAVPGVSFGNSGGVGKQTSLFLRGTESNHVLVLIDGVKVGNATSGTTPFESLPLDQIEKIEVVRGPRSSLYGSEAIGGVIQIFTRKGAKNAQPRFSVSVGSDNTYKGAVGLSGGSESAWYNFGVSGYTTSGFNSCRGSASAGCFTNEPDDDEHDNQSFSVRGGVSVTDSLTVEGNFLNANNETEFDGGFQNESETTTQLASIKATLQANEGWQTQLQISRAKDRLQNYIDCDVQVNPMPSLFGDPPCVTNVDGMNFDRVAGTVKQGKFNTERNQVGWQNNFSLSENTQIVAGVDYLDDVVVSSTDFAKSSRYNASVYALFHTAAGDNDMELALRNDDNEQFGDEVTGSVAWGRDFGSHRLTASFGTGFAVPTFNELYWPGSGNPSLKPESSKSYNFGLSHSGENTWASVDVFHTVIDDLISGFPAININQAQITGIEFSANQRSGEFDFSTSVTVQDPKDTSGGPNDGNRLARRPKTTMDIDIARQIGTHRLGINFHVRGASYDDPANNNRIPGFTTVNLRGEIRIAPNWSLGLKINNLLDKEHETVAYYPQDGINLLATLRYVP